jgi:CubicO group peptidase (beta-lactamase class C family)
MFFRYTRLISLLPLILSLTGCRYPSDLSQVPPTITYYKTSVGENQPLPNAISTEGLPGPTSTPAPAKLEPAEDWSAPIVGYLQELASAGKFSGAVLLAQNEDILLKEAFGLADRSSGIPNQVDTRFNLGSINKMFTAIAILQLVEQGRLSVDNTIAEILPDYPNPEVARQVTVHQLLTHTAGMGDCFTGEFFTTSRDQLKTVGGYLPLFADKPLQFQPGSQYSYSNEGFIVLGLIIEKISGESYFDYVQAHIYSPSGMVNTGEYELDTIIPNLAIGYSTLDAEGNDTGVLVDNTSLMPIKGTPAGGGYSTVEDLRSFWQALMSFQLLNPQSTEILLKGKVEIRENIQYAYGFLDKLIQGERVVGHGGNAPGVCNLMDTYLDPGYQIIVLSNSDMDCLLLRDFLKDHPLH